MPSPAPPPIVKSLKSLPAQALVPRAWPARISGFSLWEGPVWPLPMWAGPTCRAFEQMWPLATSARTPQGPDPYVRIADSRPWGPGGCRGTLLCHCRLSSGLWPEDLLCAARRCSERAPRLQSPRHARRGGPIRALLTLLRLVALQRENKQGQEGAGTSAQGVTREPSHDAAGRCSGTRPDRTHSLRLRSRSEVALKATEGMRRVVPSRRET